MTAMSETKKAALSGKYAAYPEYKDSGVEWLDEIPNHWDLKPIKYIFKIENGSTPQSGINEYWDGDITWVTPSDLSKLSTKFISNSSRCITSAGFNSCGTSLTPKNSLVISSRAPIGSLAITTKESCTNQGCKSLVSKSENNNIIFTYYVFSIATEQLNLLGRGTTFLELSSDDLGKFAVPYPPFNEQIQIAAFLDHETARIDTLIEKQKKLIELLKEKRQAVISHAVTKGLNPDAPMKDSGVEWLGEVPKHWSVAKLSYRYEVLLGKMLDDKKITGNYLGHYLRNTDVQWDSINISKLPMMDFRPEEVERYSVKKGDLIVCEGGEIGRCAVWEYNQPCFYQKALHRLRPKYLNDDPYFMFYVLFDAVHTERFISGAGKATIAHLPAETFKQYRFAFPPYAEQVQIVNYLNKQKEKYNQLEKAANTQINLLQERRTALISAAVTGKIDVRHFTLEDRVAPTTSSDTNEAVQEVMA
ncbi:hypothetical protein HPQ32_07085 [Photobacterium carnosum]|uniref:restriction endonuclease subunit S n=1 Tax=Photobacterium carnosum TaxID=2023717 RepID=UPI001C91F210|nr:restriction endonuclease subunit S [Photobacterium carnosum]MBY3788202.1 hypothetical protein [Photobacterium carnosum]MCD9533368.1 restriction endonuclease subunit S [Photobacterium carnosum]